MNTPKLNERLGRPKLVVFVPPIRRKLENNWLISKLRTTPSLSKTDFLRCNATDLSLCPFLIFHEATRQAHESWPHELLHRALLPPEATLCVRHSIFLLKLASLTPTFQVMRTFIRPWGSDYSWKNYRFLNIIFLYKASRWFWSDSSEIFTNSRITVRWCRGGIMKSGSVTALLWQRCYFMLW